MAKELRGTHKIHCNLDAAMPPLHRGGDLRACQMQFPLFSSSSQPLPCVLILCTCSRTHAVKEQADRFRGEWLRSGAVNECVESGNGQCHRRALRLPNLDLDILSVDFAFNHESRFVDGNNKPSPPALCTCRRRHRWKRNRQRGTSWLVGKWSSYGVKA